ncbi:MAG: RNA polymerase factor sigma-54 [Flavobacteriales bacterium]|nr:RNA polymerase factor sigma-54 [Flavobacteriales bacterium]MCX7768769.1 RNA polymerase factor sigma-54 [Flavobacteriales bacterium]MDW8409437.1 RNA polymerase factor sigma-54 [Flavobacteriales bacterium]
MLKQEQSLRLTQKLSPLQIQLMKLLQVPTALLDQRIKEELENNPALEDLSRIDMREESAQLQDEIDDDLDLEGIEDAENDLTESQEAEVSLEEFLSEEEENYYKTHASNHSPDDEPWEAPVVQQVSFHEYLNSQIGMREMDDKTLQICRHIIGNLDEDGYLRRSVSQITDDLAYLAGIEATEEEVEKALKIVQELDPPGVGARDLRECLLLQLAHSGSRDKAVINAQRILRDHFEEFTKKHYDRIQRRLRLEDGEFREAVQEILHLNPKPGSAFESVKNNPYSITPDFILEKDLDGQLHLSLNSRNAPQLRISPRYAEMLRAMASDKSQKESAQFVKQKIESAKWFIEAIKQRQDTLMKVMNAILEHQAEYFATGDEKKLKPMILKDIAEKVGLDISTVSRVTGSKYIQTPYGIKLLKDFFSESLSTDEGEEVSTREVKSILQDLIRNEEKRRPLTDEKLTEILQKKGYNIARRTVAKYREQLGIPVARLRKEL